MIIEDLDLTRMALSGPQGTIVDGRAGCRSYREPDQASLR
jgi:hypothetical protein